MRILSPSLPAITASVASSPIFFRMASSPFASSDATYEADGSAPRRDSIVAARRSRTSRAPSASADAIDLAGIPDDRLDIDPAAVFQPAKKAALASRVTGDATGLLDQKQHR